MTNPAERFGDMRWYKIASLGYAQDQYIEERQFNFGEQMHPRQFRSRTSVTEGQLAQEWPGYVNHVRRDENRTKTTEGQLEEGGYHGFSHYKRDMSTRTDTTELQLRDESIRCNSTPAIPATVRPWAKNVDDQTSQTHEGQLEDWKAPLRDVRTPIDRVTEKQLFRGSPSPTPTCRRRP